MVIIHLLVAAAAIGIRVQDSAAAELYGWMDGLGCRAKLSAPFVRVEASYRDRPKPVVCSFGFLQADSRKGFRVLLTNLGQTSFRKLETGKYAPRYSYSKYSFQKFVSTTQQTYRDVFWSVGGYANHELQPFQCYGIYATLSWICRQKGMDPESKWLLQRARGNAIGALSEASHAVELVAGREDNYTGFLEDQIALGIYSVALHRITDPSVPRVTILAELRATATRFARAKYATDFSEGIAILTEMVGEDRRHRHVSMRRASRQGRIHELIWQLRNYQIDPGTGSDGTYLELLAFGHDALPQLEGALQDHRFTRTLESDWWPSAGSGLPMPTTPNSVLRVYEVVRSLILAINHPSRPFDLWGQS